MAHELKKSVFWSIAIKDRSEDEFAAPTDRQEKRFNQLAADLLELYNQRLAIFTEMKSVTGFYTPEYVGSKILIPFAYKSSKEWFLYEDFTDDALTEFNNDGILSEAQHYAVTNSENSSIVPLKADRLMSRRELQKVTGWSNGKFNRLSGLERDPLPMLLEDKLRNTYSAIHVYQWALRHRRQLQFDESDVFSNWYEVSFFDDLYKSPPKIISTKEYKAQMPELFKAAS